MTEVVVLAERVATSISLGESHFREFKSAQEGPLGHKSARPPKEVAKDICCTLVGFANADGGELVVGVEDNGEITGLLYDEQQIEYLRQCFLDGVHRGTPLSNVRHVLLELNNKSILYFSVVKSSTAVHLTADGRCLQRKDLETIPIAAEDVQFTRQERLSQEYDRSYVDGSSADDLDIDLVKILADQISAGMTPEKCLQYLDLADFGDGYLRLRRAALLLFAKNPNRWHPRMQIRIMRVVGSDVGTGLNYNVTSDHYVEGNIVSIVEQSWTELRPHLVQTRLSGEARFETRVIYPELACREALINAIAHRDYSQEGRGIEIFVYDDRMEVVSPGGLLSSLSVEDLKKLSGAHQSRNAFIARVLREMGFMREVGEGMRRIFELMHSNELAEPDIVTSPDRFIVALRNRPLYRPEHLLWLESFSDLVLNPQEKAIVVLGYNGKEISPNDIFGNLGLVDTEEYRKLVYSLQTKGVLYSVRTKAQASSYARREHRNIRDVPRFGIRVPGKETLESRSLDTVGKFADRKKRERGNPQGESVARSANDAETFDSGARLFLGNIRGTPAHGDLLRLLWEHGVNGDVIIPMPPRGFAFVQLDDASLVEIAIERLNGAEFVGFPVVARRANPLDRGTPPRKRRRRRGSGLPPTAAPS